MPDSGCVVFPYGIRFTEGGRTGIFPAARISLLHRDGERLSLIFLIDSGAQISALPAGDAISLGIEVKKGEPISIFGIGREAISGWRHEIQARMKNEFFTLPVVFLDGVPPSRILGRAGVFGRFTIIFEELERRTGFLGKGSASARQIKKILDKAA